MKKTTLSTVFATGCAIFSATSLAASHSCPPFATLTESAVKATLVTLPSGWSTTPSQQKLLLSGMTIVNSTGAEVQPKVTMDADSGQSRERSTRQFSRNWVLEPGKAYFMTCSYHGLPHKMKLPLPAAKTCSSKTTHAPGEGMKFSALDCK